jgi:hypothetical protein
LGKKRVSRTGVVCQRWSHGELGRAASRILAATLLTAVVGCYESSPPPIVPVEAEFRIGLPVSGSDTGDLHVQQILLPAQDPAKQDPANRNPAKQIPAKQFTAEQNSSKQRSVNRAKALSGGVGGQLDVQPAGHRSGRRRVYPPMSVAGANDRLANLEQNGPDRDRMNWALDRLHTHLRPPATSLRAEDVTFVQVTMPVAQVVSPQANDAVPVPQLPVTDNQGVEVIETPSPEPTSDMPASAPGQQAPGLQAPGVPEMIPTPEGKPDVKEASPSKQTPEKLAVTEAPMANDAAAPKAETPVESNPGGLKAITDDGMEAIPDDLKPEDYSVWPTPEVTLFVTGQQNGYIEPCGCTGLEKQKGGVARRQTFMNQLRDQGWELLPIDAGNQVRRVGRQAAIKLSWSTEALKKMKYVAVGFGPDDMRLPATDLLQLAASDSPEEATYISGNVVLYDESYVPTFKVVQRANHRVGITHILDPDSLEKGVRTDAEIKPAKESAKAALEGMTNANATFKVLAFYGKEKAAAKLAKDVPGFDLLIAAGGYGEPTYQPQAIEDSKTKMIVTGNKAMYTGLVGLYADRPMKYARVPLTHEFSDAPEMRELMGEYQNQLKQVGLEALGLEPTPHLSGENFVGTATCAQCHEEAFDIWSGTPHAHATESIVSPPEDRGDVPRHFDPECLSCHVTGWNPQGYYPYESGYLSLEGSKHLHGNGCENCHGPGEGHSKAERDDSGVSDAEKERLRKSMQLPLERAKEHCMKCHDLDNSPDFHEPDAFEDEYWPSVEH